MKVLHVFDHSLPIYDGYSFRSKSILLAQRALGLKTSQLTTPRQNLGDALKEDVGEGLEFFRTPVPNGAASRLPLANYFAEMAATRRRLHELISSEKPDLIHAHSPILNARPAIQVGKSSNIPVVYEIRAFWEDAAVDQGTTAEGSVRYRLTRALETNICRRASQVVTICEGLRNDLLTRGLKPNAISVVPNAIDPGLFNPESPPVTSLIEKHDLQPGQTLGFFGSFYGFEGLDLLIRAVPLVLKRFPALKVLLGGSGEQDQNLRALCSQLGLDKQVIFLGRIPSTEMSAHYKTINLLILPRHSMRLTETVTPLKPLEAMLHRVPVVASDVGGHKEMIDHGKTGRLHKSGDIDSLAQTILLALSDTNATREQVENAYKFVLTERNWSTVARRYLNVYEQALI